MDQQTEYSFDNIGNRNSAKAGGNKLGSLRQSTYSPNSLNQYYGDCGSGGELHLHLQQSLAAHSCHA